MKHILVFFTLLSSAPSCSSNSVQQISSTDKEMNTKDILKAVRDNDLQAVKTLLQTNSNVNAADNKKQSLLLIATQNKNLEMAKLLVEHKADVNQQSDNLDSPFLYAGANGYNDFIKLFLANGAKFNVFNRYNGTALIPACERGHVETVRILANTPNFPINHVNRLGWTGLIEAVILGDGSKRFQEIVQILKDAGAKMDIPDKDGVTPLQHAEKRGFKEIARIIKS